MMQQQQLPPLPPGLSFTPPPQQPQAAQAQPRPAAMAQQSQTPANPNLTAQALFPALVQQESRGRAGAVGPDTQWGNALGRTQMLPATAREMAQRIGVPFDEGMLRGTSPEAAAYQDRLGMAYLQEGFERTGNPREALMYYHGGPDRRLWGPKTRAYADQVLARQAAGDFAQVSNGGEMSAPAGAPPLPAGLSFTPPGGEAQSAEQPSAPQMYNGRPVEISVTDPIQTDASGAYDLSNPTAAMDLEALRRGDRVTLEDGLTRTLRGTPYADNSRASDQQVGSFNLREPNATDTVGAYATASTEQIPFADEAATGLSAMLNGRGYSEERQRTLQQRERLNQTDRGARVAGGLTGFGLGLAAPGGRFIANGPSAAYRASRAAAVGSGYGALYGAGAAEGGLPARALGAGVGAATGALSGAAFSGAGDLFGGIARRAQPDAPRRLSRQGIDLTPGQMASSIPLVGTTAKYLEDVAGGFNPLMTGVRQRQNEQVIRAAGNEALSAIGAQLPREARTGYQVSQGVMQTLGQAYDDILPRVQAQADADFSDGLRDMVGRASETLDDSRLGRLNRILNDSVVGRFEADGALTGEQFKRIETTLRQQSERANRPNSTLEDQDLSEFLDEARTIVRDMIARQNPAEAERIQAINRGYAVAKRIQRAVSGGPQAAREGTPTPGELTNTVRQMSSDTQMSNQNALLQGLSSDARAVLPSSVGDTGSGQKAVLGGMAVLGTTGAAAINPMLGAGIIGGAAAYSKPGISLMNMLYRGTDRPGASAEALSRLANLARQNPALVPVYERALLQGQLSGEPRSQPPSPAARGLFGARRPQMVPQ